MSKAIEKERLSLKEWRLRKHWSFRQLAREAGISTETLLRLEKGGKVWPVTARKVVDALGVHEDQVLELELRPIRNRNGYPDEITNIAVPDMEGLLSGMTPENRHAPIDWGQPVGNEVW